MMRQKKNMFKRKAHRSLIDWFGSLPTNLTRSGNQLELKMYEHHFYKDAWEELDSFIKAT